MSFRQHRSRSPNAEWISRTIVSYGRYSEKRPAGLNVDRDGAFTLSNLMACWGVKQGLTVEGIVEALKKNMHHSHGGTQRFQLEHQPPGDVTIRVHRRHDNVRGVGTCLPETPGLPTAAGKTAQWHSTNASPASSSTWKSDDGKPQSGNGAWAGADDAKKSAPWRDPQDEAKDKDKWERSSWEKSDSWRTDEWKSDSRGDTDRKTKDSSWWDADSGTSWKQNDAWKSEKSERPSWRGDSEKLQRWIGYALKGSSSDVNVSVDSSGWAWLSSVVDALKQKKPEFGISDAKDLKTFLAETDRSGRFEVDHQQRVRKVPRDQRHTRTAPAAPRTPRRAPARANIWDFASQAPDTSSSAAAAASRSPGARSASRSKTGASGRAAYVGQVAEAVASVHAQATETASGQPKPPPGPGWTRYVDEEVFWWYYEGALGKWWMQSDDVEPMPWED